MTATNTKPLITAEEVAETLADIRSKLPQEVREKKEGSKELVFTMLLDVDIIFYLHAKYKDKEISIEVNQMAEDIVNLWSEKDHSSLH